MCKCVWGGGDHLEGRDRPRLRGRGGRDRHAETCRRRTPAGRKRSDGSNRSNDGASGQTAVSGQKNSEWSNGCKWSKSSDWSNGVCLLRDRPSEADRARLVKLSWSNSPGQNQALLVNLRPSNSAGQNPLVKLCRSNCPGQTLPSNSAGPTAFNLCCFG